MSASLLADGHRRHLVLVALVGAGLAAYLTGSVESVYGFDLALLVTLVGGFPIFSEAVLELARLRISADLAVSLAAVAALLIGQYAVAAEVVLIMLIGEALEQFAVGRTRSGIAELLTLRPEEARVRRLAGPEGGRELSVRAEDILPEDVVLVRPGERVPVDGRVTAGGSSVDQSPITGESLPADKAPGDEVFAGTINLHGALEISVERLGKDTRLEQIIRLVEEAEEAKAPTQRLADRYATWFVPAVIAAAVVTWFVSRDAVRSVAVLVVACPCALVLATPTAIAAGLGGLVRRGILVKGGAALEALGRLRAVVFDKTGTLTRAKLRIRRIVSAAGHDEAEVLRLAAAVERNSEHPIGRLIVERAREEGIEPGPAGEDAARFAAHPGLGAAAVVAGEEVRVGSGRFLKQAGVAVPEDLSVEVEELGAAGCTVSIVARGPEAIGAAAVEDTPRAEARAAVRGLRELGIGRIVMLTGDNAHAARSVAEALGIDEVRSGLLPDGKVEAVEEIRRDARPVAMVGDGINDAPSLVTADVGVAMADIGTDVAVASADVVLVGDDLGKLVEAVRCGRRALRIMWQNILGFALAFNVLAVLVASMGWISPVVAAVLHQVSSLVVCLNSLRLLINFRNGGLADAVRRWQERARLAWQLVRLRRRLVAAASAAVALVIWLASGLHVVRIGEVAAVQHFGRVLRPPEAPGLHYRLPYPFGRHRKLRPEEVRRVEVGFRTVRRPTVLSSSDGSLSPRKNATTEWNVGHWSGRYERRTDEATVWAGDHSLVDVNLVVQYRLADPLAALFAVGERLPDGASKWDALVRAAAEAALHAEMSRLPAGEILSARRSDIERAIRERVADMMARLGTGFRLAGPEGAVCLGDVHPPLEVVPAFREVASALEEKEARKNEAQGYSRKTEALARGRAAQRQEAARAFYHDRTERARGGARRFVRMAEAYGRAPELTRLRLYLETVEGALAGRRKVILDRAPEGARRHLFLGRKGLWNLAGEVSPAAVPSQDGAPERPADGVRQEGSEDR